VRRLLLCLPLCLLLAPEPTPTRVSAENEKLKPAATADNSRTVGFAVGCWTAPLCFPLPNDAAMEHLAKTDVLAFFRQCLSRYDREIRGYTATLDKTERLDGDLQPPEVLAVSFREQPFSALLEWQKNARLAKKSLYVKGQNNDKLLVLPNGKILSLAGVVERDADGPSAKKSGRYSQAEFGIKIGTERTLVSWEQAKKDNALHVEFLGQKKMEQAGNRVCYVFKRAPYEKQEEDGITEATIYVDKETWLQVGSVLKGADGLIGEYWFHDIKLNPEFKADTFTRKGLSR
jgi:Protein of unknown function (DUF1571)